MEVAVQDCDLCQLERSRTPAQPHNRARALRTLLPFQHCARHFTDASLQLTPLYWLLRRPGSRLLKGKARGPRILGLCALCQARKVISPVTATLLLYSRLRKWVLLRFYCR